MKVLSPEAVVEAILDLRSSATRTVVSSRERSH